MKNSEKESVQDKYRKHQDRERVIANAKLSKPECSWCLNTGMVHKRSVIGGNLYVFRCNCAVAYAQDYAWPNWSEADSSIYE